MRSKNIKIGLIVSVIVVLCIVMTVLFFNERPGDATQPPNITTAPTTETNFQNGEGTIGSVPEGQYYTMEDFSSLVVSQSTYEDVCKLIPQEQQPEMNKRNSLSYCDYPTEAGGFIRIFYLGKELMITAIEHYPVSGAFYREKEKGKVIAADDGTEYVRLGTETSMRYIGEIEFAGGIHGEEETDLSSGLPKVLGMYKIKNSENDNLLIRKLSQSEWYCIYRKASLPEVEISLGNCTRLEFIAERALDIPVEHATCGEGIVNLEEIEKFLTEIPKQKDPAAAGLYDLVKKPNGMFENCYQCGAVLACFAEEPDICIWMPITSYNDLGYSISIGNNSYALPESWVEKLHIK